MFVVYNVETGWSDESMRFASKREAYDWIAERDMPWLFAVRAES